jgi:hypothetical protein
MHLPTFVTLAIAGCAGVLAAPHMVQAQARQLTSSDAPSSEPSIDQVPADAFERDMPGSASTPASKRDDLEPAPSFEHALSNAGFACDARDVPSFEQALDTAGVKRGGTHPSIMSAWKAAGFGRDTSRPSIISAWKAAGFGRDASRPSIVSALKAAGFGRDAPGSVAGADRQPSVPSTAPAAAHPRP